MFDESWHYSMRPASEDDPEALCGNEECEGYRNMFMNFHRDGKRIEIYCPLCDGDVGFQKEDLPRELRND